MKKIVFLTVALLATYLSFSSFTNSTEAVLADSYYNDADSNKIFLKGVTQKSNAKLFIGGANISQGGKISKTNFLKYIQSPFSAIDSSNKTLTVESFDFSYCEKHLSEDSTGREMIVTECISDNLNGNILSKNWLSSFSERAYKGDSIVFDNFYLRDGKRLMRAANKIVVVVTD